MKWSDHLPLSPPDIRECEYQGHRVDVNVNQGGRITRWIYQGEDLIGSHGPDPIENGMYPMAPWAGRLTNNRFQWGGKDYVLPASHGEFALHGVLLDQPVESFATELDQHHFDIAMTYAINNWVAPIQVEIKHRIRADSLESTITGFTDSLEPIPCLLGWHPWFNNIIGTDQRLTFTAPDALVAIRDGYFPSGELVHLADLSGSLDDAIRVPSKIVTIEWGSQLTLKIENSHEWFVIFDGTENFTCIEPQTGPPNVFNNSIGCESLTTSAGNPLTMSTKWSFSNRG